MSKELNKPARVAIGAGLALGGAALAVAALYTEVMTTVVARRRHPAADMLSSVTAGKATVTPTGETSETAETAEAPTEAPADSLRETLNAAAEALLSIPAETVAIRSKEGYVLRARWYPAEGALRTVILAHGWHSQWNRDFCSSAPHLHETGCNLLLIDQRCHGESGGDLISYGINERYDILSWLDWLEANHPGYPVYLYGVSMGAATVLMATGLSIGERVRGVIADCGYSTPKEIVKITLEKGMGKLAGPTLAAVNLNCKLREGFTLGDYTPIEAMAQNTDVPCLFIHGDEDRFVPWRMSVENYYACRAPKELMIIHGAGHGVAYQTDTEAYRSKLAEFFAAYDLPVSIPQKKKGLFKKKEA